MSPLRWTLVALSFAAALAVSVWVVVSTWPKTGGSIALPLRAHLFALGLTSLDVVTRAMKLRWSARAIGFELRARPALRATLGGDFGGAITPSRSGTEPARFLILTEAKVGAGNAMVLLFTELALEITSLLIVVIGLAMVLPRLDGALAGFAGVVVGFVALLLGALAIALVLSGPKHRRGGAPRWATRIGLHGIRWRRMQQTHRQLRERLGALRGARPGWALAALAVSLVHVAARISVLAALVRTVAPAVPLAPLVVWPLTLYYGAGVAPAPGGAGVVEVAYRSALGSVIPATWLGASLVWWRFYTFYLPLLAGAIVAGRVVTRAVKAKQEREGAEIPAAA
ncbi:MAG: flippase-like domain-containing protein [Gemmatimonadaceae bacterium]|nr:flippase-like domain-containing protein [Gemmatimonadaceae bacterium]